MVIRRIARPLLSVAFIGQGVESLLNPKAAAEAAAPAVDGLQALPDQVARSMPNDPQTFAQITAGVQIGGGLLLATGKMPRVASAVLALTVLPANFGSYSFWNESDPQRKAERRREFLKDLSLLGGLMIASADTAGKPSLGWRGRKAAERLSDRVSSVLPGSDDTLFDADLGELGEKIAHGLHVGAERGRELASTAAERSAPYAEAALDRGRELASTAAERGAPYAELALDRGRELASAAAERAEPLAKKARKRGEQLADEVAERAEKARRRSEKLAEEAAEKAGPLAKKARKRSEKLAKNARARGEEFAESARTHGNQLADAARDRVGGQVKTRRRPW
ncbi:DoxX family membrane protein [Mycobacterium sp. pR1184]|uniref:DoxX family protein n=1 Tax=Mycobacterium sp. pR1184 TaxID=3238981 RepID=UPI00351B0BCD